ncbi:MAG: hypothetical protein U9N10_09515 [Bacillota bacterium]|nr:hypothetical protein [Bacillota bacterium]
MKKYIKIALVIICLIIFIISGLVLATVILYSGDDDFAEVICSKWKTTQLEKNIQFEIFKGNREIKGYTYGYFDAIYFEDYSYHIRYKNGSLEFHENDSEQFLIYNPDNDTLSGEIYLPTDASKTLTSVILKKY